MHRKRIEEKRDKEQIENENQKKSLWNQGFSLLKTYGIRKEYTGYEVHEYELTEGSLYCPQIGGEKIKMGVCEDCQFYHGEIFDKKDYCTRVICGFKSGLTAERMPEETEE